MTNRYRHRRPMRARNRKPPGGMNRTELAYAEELSDQVRRQVISSWRFEAVKLRLADLTWYTPDFWVQLVDGAIQIHEVKACKSTGQMLCEDDAKVKIKVAAELYHEFDFWLYGKLPLKCGGGWKAERVSREG